MARRTGISVLATAALIAWAGATRGDEGPGDNEPGKPATGAIVGRLVDLQGRPVADAEVWALVRREDVAKARTDADGRFRLGPIKDDMAVTVWAAAEGRGLARERWEDVVIFAGKDHDLGSIALVPGTRINGRVVDAQGRPIAGANVGLEVYRHVLGHTIDSDQARWKLTTDPQGRLQTPPLPPGAANFYVAAPGKVRTSVGRATEPGTDEIDLGDIRLDDEQPVAGIVVDQDGQPAPRVQVFADYDYENVATTDAQGRFRLGGVGKDARELRLDSNDYFAPAPFPIAGNRADLRLTVQKAYEIHGSAVDAETGQPVPIGTVRLCMVRRDPDDGTVTLLG